MGRVSILIGLIFTFTITTYSQSFLIQNEKKADRLFTKEKYENACLEYHAVLDKDPKNNGVRIKLARTYFKLGQYEEAGTYYSNLLNNTALAKSSDYLNFAICLNALNDHENAEYWATKYLMINPVDNQVQNLLFRLKNRNSQEFSFSQSEPDISSTGKDSGTLLTIRTGIYTKSYLLTKSKVVEIMKSTSDQDIHWVDELFSDNNILINKKVSIEPILFEQGQSEIDEHHKSELNKLVDLMKGYEQLGFEISGHSDSSASEIDSQLLSQLRASAAREFLLARDIPDERLQAIGNAANDPVCKDQLASCSEQGLNRRLEFRLVYMDKNRMISTY